MRYTQTITQGGGVIVRQGQALVPGFDFESVSPWSLSGSVDYLVNLGRDATLDLRAEDAYRSQNPGPFAQQDPQSASYIPGYQPDPATNLLNLRATVRWQHYEASLFLNNAFDSLPTIQRTNATGEVTQTFIATTFRPRTVGLSVSWRL